jgi:hypothetical protein
MACRLSRPAGHGSFDSKLPIARWTLSRPDLTTVDIPRAANDCSSPYADPGYRPAINLASEGGGIVLGGVGECVSRADG